MKEKLIAEYHEQLQKPRLQNFLTVNLRASSKFVRKHSNKTKLSLNEE